MARLARFFGFVHGHVGVAEERIDVCAGLREDNTDAGGNRNHAPVHRDGTPQGRVDAAHDRQHLASSGDPLHQDCEFVTAHACHGIRRPQLFADALGDDLKQPIARLVAEAVVDGLEIVEIEEHDGDASCGVAHPNGHRVFQTIAKQRSIRQAGERIVQYLMPKRCFELLALRNVAEHRLNGGRAVIRNFDRRGVDVAYGPVNANQAVL